MSNDSAAANLPHADEKAQTNGDLTVASIMISNVHVVTPQMTVKEAIQLLVTHKISGAPVVDQGSVVVSVVSEGDLLKLAATLGLDKKIALGIDKLITPDKMITAKKTDSFTDVYRMFLKYQVHRIVVVDANFKLLGIVSRSNVLRLIANLPA
ncbi:MAG: CBS domain-containing protein [Bdellovibrionota bacterium]